MKSFVKCGMCEAGNLADICVFATFRKTIEGKGYIFCCPVTHRKLMFDRKAVYCARTDPDMTNREKTETDLEKPAALEIEEYLKQIPLPPEEHGYELKMEKQVKRMLKEQEKKAEKK